MIGKPPDFVLEVASKTTGKIDYTDKRVDYERYGVAEYCRFDSTGGEYHDASLAGDRLVYGRYEPIEIERVGELRLRGYSEALGLYICWELGELRFYDPGAGAYLRTHYDEAFARQAASARAEQEAARADREAAARIRAEAEIRRLKEMSDAPDKSE